MYKKELKLIENEVKVYLWLSKVEVDKTQWCIGQCSSRSSISFYYCYSKYCNNCNFCLSFHLSSAYNCHLLVTE